MKKVNLGIIGCGVIGQMHLKHAAASPHIHLSAVADIRMDAAKQAAEKFSVDQYYTNPADIFNDPAIDGVVLALQTSIRTELALQAFAKGKHVLLEKPVAMNVNEVEQLLAAKGDLIAGCCSSRFRFTESARFIEPFIQSGVLGKLRVIRCRISNQARKPDKVPPIWLYSKAINGGGTLADWGVYDLDYLLGLTGWSLKPKYVVGNVWTIPETYQSYIAEGSDAETHAAASIYCEDGTVIQYERGTQVTAKEESAWQLIGTNGSLDLNMLPGNNKQILFHEANAEEGIRSKVVWEGSEDWEAIHRGPITDFAEAILEGREPAANLTNSLGIQKIIDGMYAAAELKKAVEL